MFHCRIGGYKPLDKFLKSRRGRALTPAAVTTVEKAAGAISFTLRKMAEIDP